MNTDVESRASAAFDRWASTMRPERPPIDELLGRSAVTVAPEPTLRSGVSPWAAAAVAAVLVGTGAMVIALRRDSDRERDAPPVSDVTTETSTPATTGTPIDTEPAGFAPATIPEGYRVTRAEAWEPSPAETPLVEETWVRRSPDGGIVDELTLSATEAAPPGGGWGGDAIVHGQPAALTRPDPTAGITDTTLQWNEGNLTLAMTTSDVGVDLVALAEQANVDASGIALAAAAVPPGFDLLARDQPRPRSNRASTVVFMNDDITQTLSVSARPNTLGQPLEAFVRRGASLRTIGERRVVMENFTSGAAARWIADGYIVEVAAADEATLLQFLGSVRPVDEAAFDGLVDLATADASAEPRQDDAVFPDGLRVSLHAPALVSASDPPTTPGSICLEADRVRCGSREASWSGPGDWRLDQVGALVTVNGRTQSLYWIHDPATEVSRVADADTGQAVPFATLAGDHGVFLRVEVPEGTSRLSISAWYGDGNRDTGGGGITSQIDVGRVPLSAAVSTADIDPPAPTGFMLPTDLPPGFRIDEATATTPDLTLHDPISQDYWVRRDEGGTVTDVLSLVARAQDRAPIAAPGLAMTVRDLAATMRTDAAGVTTIEWDELGQRITATSTIDALELASAIQFVSVRQDGGASLVTPARFEHIDRSSAIVAADPLAVSTEVRISSAAGGAITIRSAPNVGGASLDTIPPAGPATVTTVGPHPARVSHLGSEDTTRLDWVAEGFLFRVEGQNVEDATLLAMANAIRRVDQRTFGAATSG